MYAAQSPFEFTLHVPLVQIGKLGCCLSPGVLLPKKHLDPHLRYIRVRAAPKGAERDQPAQGTDLRPARRVLRPPVFLVRLAIIIYHDIFFRGAKY